MNKPWLKSYDYGVRGSLKEYPTLSLYDFIRRQASIGGRQKALSYYGRKISYTELVKQSERMALGLFGKEIKKGDRVALVLPNCPQLVIAECAAWHVGAVACVLDPMWAAEDIGAAIKQLNVKAVIFEAHRYKEIKELKQDMTALTTLISTECREYMPKFKKLGMFFKRESRAGADLRKDYKAGKVLKFSKIVAKYPEMDQELIRVKLRPSDLGVILVSKKEEGRYTEVLYNHQSLVTYGIQLRSWFDLALEFKKDVVLVLAPMWQALGCVGAQGMTFVGSGMLALGINERNIGKMGGILKKLEATFIVGGLECLKESNVEKEWLACVKACFGVGTERDIRPLENKIKGRVVRGWTGDLCQTAGLLGTFKGKKNTQAMGVPLSDVEGRIISGEDMASAGEGELGELVLNGPAFGGQGEAFLGNMESGEMAWSKDSSGKWWLRTGVSARMKEGGWFFLEEEANEVQEDLEDPSEVLLGAEIGEMAFEGSAQDIARDLEETLGHEGVGHEPKAVIMEAVIPESKVVPVKDIVPEPLVVVTEDISYEPKIVVAGLALAENSEKVVVAEEAGPEFIERRAERAEGESDADWMEERRIRRGRKKKRKKF